MNLRTINVIGEENCFFRAISVCVYGNQSRYKELRANVVSHILADRKKIFARINFSKSGDNAIRKSADAIKLDGSWVGEDATLAAADYLRQKSMFSSHLQRYRRSLILRPQMFH